MPRLVAGSGGEAVELQDLDAGIWFEIAEGGLDALFDVRGSDTIIPGKDGRERRSRAADRLPVVLRGFVAGDPVLPGLTRRQTYLARIAALKDAGFYPVSDPFPLVIHPGASGVGGGLATGETATLNIQCLRFVGPQASGDQFRRLDIECESIDSPPEWVIA